MTPDDAVAAHALSRGFVDAARLEAARKRLVMLRQAGMASDLLGALAPALAPAQVAELRAVAANPGGVGSTRPASSREAKLTAPARPAAVLEDSAERPPTRADTSGTAVVPQDEAGAEPSPPVSRGRAVLLGIAGLVVIVGGGALAGLLVARARQAPDAVAAPSSIPGPAPSGVVPPLPPPSAGAPDAPPPTPTATSTAAGTWTVCHAPNAPAPRWGHVLVWDARRRVAVLFGGRDGARAFADTWTWDGARWTEEAQDSGPTARDASAAAYDEARGRLVLHGGASGDEVLGGTWEHDGARWTWAAAGGEPGERAGHAMVWDAARRRVVLLGGVGAGGAPARLDLWAWDGRCWTVIDAGLAPGPSPRTRFALAWDTRRDVLVVYGGAEVPPRGRGAPARVLDDHWEWSPAGGWSRRDVEGSRRDAQGPGPRAGAVLVAGLDGGLLLAGGWDGQRARDDAWLLDGQRWSPASTAALPPARADAAAARDVGRGVVVLFGGQASAALGDAWELTQ